MSLKWKQENQESNLLSFFGSLKTKQDPLSANSQSIMFQERSSSNHNSKSGGDSNSDSNTTRHDEIWSSSSIKSQSNAQWLSPGKRYKLTHDTTEFFETASLGSTILGLPIYNSPKKRHPPPQPIFRPPPNQRLYRLNCRPLYTEPKAPSGIEYQEIPFKKTESLPLTTTATLRRTTSASSMFSYSFEASSLPPSPVAGTSPTPLVSSYTPPVGSAHFSSASQPVESVYNETSPNTAPALIVDKMNDEYGPPLSDEQQRVLDMVVKDRQSIFLTGSAGTGKSVLMREMIRALRKKYGGAVAVTASTGIAACNIGGVTLHGFAGIGLGVESSAELIRRVEQNPAAKERWRKTYILIIDEISMVDAVLFDKLADIGKHVHGRDEAFGGIQIIVTGDFFQLPPVKGSGFAFEAKTWSSVIKKTVILAHVYRQKDPAFVEILNEIRVGKLSHKSITLLKSLDRSLPESSIEPTRLYPVKHQVEKSNNMRLEALVGPIHEFQAIDSGRDVQKLDNCIAPAMVRLKKDAQVILLRNMDVSLVNGSLGIVVGFSGEGDFDTVDSIMASLFPRRRERVNVADLQNILSRRCPVVRFANGRQHVIEYEVWSIHLADGTEIATRQQVPLVLAWALSIHKSQGQTLDRVVVDLEQSFEDGMAYVALSRATSWQSLQIRNFNPIRVTASQKVVAFYKTLKHAE